MAKLLRASLSRDKEAPDNTPRTPSSDLTDTVMSIPTEMSPKNVFAPNPGTNPRTSCAAATDPLFLANRTCLRFRRLSSDDRDGLARLFARLSPESRRRRFFSPKHALTPAELAFLTDIDHVGHEAIAAVDQRDGSIVGVARYVRWADRVGVADVAVAVADELQSIGIGTELSRRLVERACANGFTLLTASTLWENRPARALLRRLGFRARASHGSEIELELELEPGSDCSPPMYAHLHPYRDRLNAAQRA
jgi:RimJ/RimL family protein N-acetyltransferase